MELDRIRLLGNFVHNNKVLERNEGELKVVRRPPHNIKGNPFDYLSCQYCYGFIHKAVLNRHVRTCEFVDERKEKIHRRGIVTRHGYISLSGVGRSIMGGRGGGGIFIYSCSQTLKKSISKEVNNAEHEYMNIAPPPPPNYQSSYVYT